MNDIKLILEGFIIGIGKIIPGVSGAMFAMMFGVYEKSLNILSNLRKEFIKNFKFICLLGISILLAIILGSNIIKTALDKYYMETMFLFIGMMIAGIKPLLENVKEEKFNFKYFLIALIISFLLVVLDSVDLGINTETLTRTPYAFFMIMLSGIFDALATIIPGVCGTALLMIIGYYNIVIDSLSNILNLNNLSNNLFVLIPFTIGLITGILMFSKLVNYLFLNHKTQMYYIIVGFSIMSIILLFLKAMSNPFEINRLIISTILLIIGFIIVHFLEKIKV